MKRFLLSVFLTGLFVYGQAQSKPEMIINEVYVDPAPEAHEFIELINTSNEWKNTDCYQVVVFYDKGTNKGDKGFYVLDFPSINVQPGGYVVGAANNPFNYQQTKGAIPDFNWNTFQGKDGSVLTGGSLKNYVFNEDLNAPNGGYEAGVQMTTQDLFWENKDNVTGGIRYAIFLFNNGVFVNGLLGGYNAGELTAQLKIMPPLTLTPNCSSAVSTPITWGSLPANEFVIAASGKTDNGYIRKYDGICGEWEKSSSTGGNNTEGGEHTPGRTNGFSDRDPAGLTTSAQLSVCGQRIEISITEARFNYVFPVTVLLYEDAAVFGKLDAGDTYLTQITITETSGEFHLIENYPNPAYVPGGTEPQYLPLDPDKKYLLVYKTALGCLDRMIVPDLPNIATTQKNFCGNKIDFVVSSAPGSNAESYLPIEVKIYHDINNNGIYDSGTDVLMEGSKDTINSYLEQTSYTIPDMYKSPNSYLMVYTSLSQTCITKTIRAQQAQGSLATTQRRDCGSTVGSVLFNISGATGDAIAEYVFPIKVVLYRDLGDVGKYLEGTDEKISDTITIESFEMGEQLINFTLQDPYDPVIIVYRTRFDCLGKSVSLETTCSPLPVHFTTFTATRKQKRVALEWKTATEVNNNGFYVQRNINGEWKDIAFVFSQAENGNSSALLTYSYNDNNDAKGLSQYRILQVDKSGKGTYSEVRAVRGEVQSSKIMVYPNPSTNGAVNVLFEEGSSAKDVQVSDVMGRVIKAYQNVTSASLVIENLTDGFYTIQITDRHTAASTVEKVVVKKR